MGFSSTVNMSARGIPCYQAPQADSTLTGVFRELIAHFHLAYILGEVSISSPPAGDFNDVMSCLFIFFLPYPGVLLMPFAFPILFLYFS